MKERPILFSAPMIRAILEGRKTMTRRVVKRVTEGSPYPEIWVPLPGTTNKHTPPCPYGQPGDRLWVRETWAWDVQAQASLRDEDGPFAYAADPFAVQRRLCPRWRPSIHMPRWASRITLEITGVRVERLQDISEQDAMAEGIRPFGDGWGHHVHDGLHYMHRAADSFASLWESINGAGSWDTNPWVWVVEFKRIEQGKA
jgi:hypothetical protein